jgi:curli biogenesis system outer membrane secretion channel CsgG
MRIPLHAGIFLLAAGCATHRPDPQTSVTKDSDGRLVIKPVVAVIDFDNRANFEGQWKLGEGMAELLAASLLDSDKVIVLERKNINQVVGEISRQGEELFRKEGRVERGRLMNAQLLIRGVITDFTVIGDSSGWLSFPHFLFFGNGSKARVAMNIYVVDVASGKILASVKSDGTASAGGAGGKIDYKNVTFGGDSFFRTPLGKATESAIEHAVKQILKGVPQQPWSPVVAEVEARDVIINGGRNVNLQEGMSFIVRETARDVTDPVTGNIIEQKSGRVLGRIQITHVLETSAHATLVEGSAQRGDKLETMEMKK